MLKRGLSLSAALICFAFSASAQTLVRVWASDAVFRVPESVNYNPAKDVLIVSNINGKPSAKDGNGFLSLLTTDGKLLNLHWVDGLNAPKGAALVGNRLYVADIDRVVVVNVDRGSIVKRIPLPGAQFLNDVAADKHGTVYVSDTSSKNSAIYRLKDDRPEVWLRSPTVRNPNGLAVEGNTLYVGNTGTKALLRVDLRNGQVTVVASVGFGIDGLKPVGDGDFLLSDWLGNVFLLGPGGNLVHLLKPAHKNLNAADIEYLPDRKLLLIPTFFDNRVVAYRLR